MENGAFTRLQIVAIRDHSYMAGQTDAFILNFSFRTNVRTSFNLKSALKVPIPYVLSSAFILNFLFYSVEDHLRQPTSDGDGDGNGDGDGGGDGDGDGYRRWSMNHTSTIDVVYVVVNNM